MKHKYVVSNERIHKFIEDNVDIGVKYFVLTHVPYAITIVLSAGVLRDEADQIMDLIKNALGGSLMILEDLSTNQGSIYERVKYFDIEYYPIKDTFIKI